MAVPTVTTSPVTAIGQTSATGNGNVTATGGNPVTRRGIQWSPTTTADKEISEDGYFSTGAFTGAITGLSAGLAYKARAFAENSDGIGYGSWVNFNTLSAVYSFTIGGVERKTDVLNQTIRIEDVINDQVNSLSFRMMDRSSLGVPDTDDEVIITLDDGSILFGGFVISTHRNSKKESGDIIISVECVDYTRLMDRNLVHKTYENMTDKAVIDDIVSTYMAGFGITTTNVIEGVTIEQISFNYVQPSQAIRRIAELTGRHWYIDYNKDIHYFPLTTETTPFNLSDHSSGETFIRDNMISSVTGTLKNSATFSSVDSYVTLTTAIGSDNGQIEYTNGLASNFVMEFDAWAGGGSGADSIYAYWGASSTPTGEDDNVGGYIVALDEFTDEIQLKFAGSSLDSVAYADLDNSQWRKVKIEVTGTNIKVYVGNVLQIDFDDSARTLGGSLVGLGARTGGVDNEHRVKVLHVYSVSDASTDYTNLNITKDGSLIKNRVYVRGGTELSDETTYVEFGNGEKRKIVLPDKPRSVTVEVDTGSGYVTQTLGIKNVDTSGFQWYLNFQEKYIEQDASETVLSATDKMRITYKYDVPILVAVEDTDSIIANGQREHAIFDKSIRTTQGARDRASAELTDYANNLIEGSFTTRTHGFTSGQYINVNLTDYAVNEDYIVQRVTARSLGAGEYIYDVKLASAKTLGIIGFLIKLLEADRNLIELDDNEVVDELLNLSDSLIDDSLEDQLTIDSHGAYSTWAQDSDESLPITIAKWNLFQWG